jgi:hypothetical protein
MLVIRIECDFCGGVIAKTDVLIGRAITKPAKEMIEGNREIGRLLQRDCLDCCRGCATRLDAEAEAAERADRMMPK